MRINKAPLNSARRSKQQSAAPYQQLILIGAAPSSALSQCFSRSYASILPTSLGHIAPLTRAFSARIPDAVIGTDEPVREAPPTTALCHASTTEAQWDGCEYGSQVGLSEG